MKFLALAYTALSLLWGATAATAQQPDPRDVASNVTTVGYMDPTAILLFNDKPNTLFFAKEGDTVGGITLDAVHGMAVRAHVGNYPWAVVSSEKPLPIAEYQLQDYLVNLCKKIDALIPGVSEKHQVTIKADGSPLNDPTAVWYFKRAQPFVPLPTGVESITFNVQYGPELKTKAIMVKMQVTKPVSR